MLFFPPLSLTFGTEGAMSLLSIAVAVLQLYYVAVRVVVQQLFSRALPTPEFPVQKGAVAFVTGGGSGIGYHTAKHLAKLGMHVIIAAHNEDECRQAVRTIKEETQNEKAGVMLVPKRETVDGFEEHFGLNYLGHFLLTNLLLDTLKKTGTNRYSARIVTMASAVHYAGELHLDDLQSSCYYSPHGAYAQSKLALVLFTYHLHHHLTEEGSHVTANAVDPGVVNTELYKNTSWPVRLVKWMTSWLFMRTPEEGAATTIYAAGAPELEGIGGCYLYNGAKTQSSDLSYDEELQRRLWTASCKMTGVPDVTGICAGK
ncbi:polyprenol dehydrogenase isoform X2 [Ambystoma mexicanum]|uniref:polyprenol dehydrogenase isoform X2 n=1 Tax=Ambystoma mexicanum TaxID=8296 RepID=UPI0037E906DD